MSVSHHTVSCVTMLAASEETTMCVASESPMLLLLAVTTTTRPAEWLTADMAAVVTTSVACSCCGQTNCIVTKVTTTGRRDPSCHRSCLPSPWRLTQRSASTHRFKYHYPVCHVHHKISRNSPGGASDKLTRISSKHYQSSHSVIIFVTFLKRIDYRLNFQTQR